MTELTCQQAAELLSAELDGELAPEEEARLADHLADCRACQRRRALLAGASAAFRETAPERSRLTARAVLARARQETSGRGAVGRGASGRGAVGRGTVAGGAADRDAVARPPRPRRLAARPALLAAAAALLLLASGALLVLDRPAPRLSHPPAAATSLRQLDCGGPDAEECRDRLACFAAADCGGEATALPGLPLDL